MKSAGEPGQCRGKPITLTANDGYVLAGTLYEPADGVRGHLIVAGAIGVSQRHYQRFAQHAADAGWRTLTLDYRGIGRSRPSNLRALRMDYFDWGRLDLAAAVERMRSGQHRLCVIGHSYAGHAFGALPEPERVAAFATFGTGAGWHGWMPRLEQLRVLALWHGVGPILTRSSGYLSWSRLGMGEDLPLDFYRQWKQWCRLPRNFLDDARAASTAAAFARIRAPVLAANATDDRWSPPRSRDAIMAAYANAELATLDLVPESWGMADIGHLGYFRRDASRLWNFALDWCDRMAASPTESAMEPATVPATAAPTATACRSWSSEPMMSTSANCPGVSEGSGATTTSPSISGASAAERASRQG